MATLRRGLPVSLPESGFQPRSGKVRLGGPGQQGEWRGNQWAAAQQRQADKSSCCSKKQAQGNTANCRSLQRGPPDGLSGPCKADCFPHLGPVSVGPPVPALVGRKWLWGGRAGGELLLSLNPLAAVNEGLRKVRDTQGGKYTPCLEQRAPSGPAGVTLTPRSHGSLARLVFRI